MKQPRKRKKPTKGGDFRRRDKPKKEIIGLTKPDLDDPPAPDSGDNSDGEGAKPPPQIPPGDPDKLGDE